MAMIVGRLGGLRAGGNSIARGGNRLWRVRRVNAGAHQEKQIDEKDCDKDEAADEDVRSESHHGFVLWEVGGRNVFVLVVAFVMVFGHAHKLTSPKLF